jgi:hypothetical protein
MDVLGTKYTYGAFTPDVKSVLNENLGGILGGYILSQRKHY